MNSSKHMFPGGNTSNGFVNYFDGIIPPWGVNNRTYILKGGPGVGKNTFMKAIGSWAEKKDYETEYFHCASDMESLDAVRIPELGITMLDGTAPHVIDPVMPGAADGIINLGIYLNEQKLEEKKEDIKKCLKENSFCYQKTFAYLKAAGILQRSLDTVYLKSTDEEKLQKAVFHILEKHIKTGICRKSEFNTLFSAAITPQGYTDYSNTIIKDETVIRIKGPSGIIAEFFEIMKKNIAFTGWHISLFQDPLLPDHTLHIIIQELNLCITSGEPVTDEEKVQLVDLNQFMEDGFLNRQKEAILFHQEQINLLKNAAINSLKESKQIHDVLESIYKQGMDFESATEYTTHFIEKLTAE